MSAETLGEVCVRSLYFVKHLWSVYSLTGAMGESKSSKELAED